MSLEGLEPVVFEQFGGMESLPDPQDVTIGKAIDAKNVEFRLGSSVQTRAGRSVFLAINNGPAILSMAEFALLDGVTRRLLIFGSDGTFWKENGDLSLALIESGLGPSVRVSQQTMFGRQYLGFSDGKLGNAPPRYYDDANLYRVSQSGPGEAPNGQSTAILSPPGSVDAGTHFVRIIFEMADGYRSAPSPAVAILVATAGRSITLSRIPRGPSNVVRRIIVASAAISADLAPLIDPVGVRYFFIPNSSMVINNNITQTATIDFSDAQLTAAEDVTDLLFQIVLPEQAGVTAFDDRLVWWGGQNDLYRVADTGLLNMHFDGGFAHTLTSDIPNGWDESFPGGAVVSNVPGATGAVFRIIADGIGQRGTIKNLVQGTGLNMFIRPDTAYGGRLRLRKSPGLTQGSVSLYFLESGSVVVGGGGGLTVDASQLTTDFQDFSGEIFPATPILPLDLVLKISGGKGGDGFTTVLAPAGEYIDVDFAGLYPINQPYTPSLLYLSKPGLPGAYDDNNLINVAENNGQAIRRCFPIRGQLYVCKEQSLFVASDTGGNASDWPVQEVSNSVGTPSLNGVSGGEGWVVIAARAGLYFFDGGFPLKISEEIQPTWDRINWDKGHLIVVQVDTEEKRIFIQVPFDGATDINRTLYLDYTGANPVQSRNWCPDWTTAASSMALSRRSDGTLAILFGSLDGSGEILRLDSSLPIDGFDGIESFYRTAFGGGPSGRNTFQYLTASAYGAGTLRMTAIGPDNSTTIPLRDRALTNQPNRDIEWSGLRVNGERIAWDFGTSGLGDWFKMRKLVPYGRPSSWSRTRGQP